MNRFAILEHDHPFLHWDLFLECETALNTWRLLQYPHTAKWIPAERLGDHRMMYLDYEGPVSNNRGHVTRVDSGQYEETESEFENQRRFRFRPGRLANIAVVRTAEDGSQHWWLE